MIPLKAKLTYRYTGENTFALKTKPSQRLLFLSIFLLLSAAFFFGIGSGIEKSEIPGTVFYFFILVLTGGAAAWNRTVLFNRVSGSGEIQRRLGPVKIWASTAFDLDSVEAVVLQTVTLASGFADRKSDEYSPFKKYVDKRRFLHRMIIDVAEKRIFLEDSASREELEEMGKALAGFLGKPFRAESM
ncbi:MAG: hypothetical protein ACLFST_01975 [Spirochaetia bacterium]